MPLHQSFDEDCRKTRRTSDIDYS